MKNECYSLDKQTILRVIAVNGICPYEYSVAQVFNLEQVLPARINICLFHTIYPYYLTLLNNGNFPWVKEQKTVIVQCPRPDGGIVMKIRYSPCSGKHFFIDILKNANSCIPFSDNITINEKDLIFCPHVLNEIFFLVNNKRDHPNSKILIGCCNCYPNRVIFELQKK